MIYIIIPVYNRKAFTRSCLLSLQKQTFKDFKTVVVDDGSTDDTSAMLKDEFPEVDVLFGDGSLFWTASMNMGIRYALENKAKYILSLNNDTIASKEFLEKMMYWSSKKPEALLGALAIDHKTGKPVFGGAIINWKFNTTRYLIDELAVEEQNGLHEVTHYPGRGLFIPRQVFEKIGLFSEEVFPHYYADYDFTHRAVRAGFKVYCNYDAWLTIFPEESGDFNNRKKKNLKNYINHLFGLKGGGNLRNFTKYTLRNCPAPYIPYFLINGYLRRIFGYLIK